MSKLIENYILELSLPDEGLSNPEKRASSRASTSTVELTLPVSTIEAVLENCMLTFR